MGNTPGAGVVRNALRYVTHEPNPLVQVSSASGL